MQWVEVHAKSVEDAVAEALLELEMTSREDVSIEVLQEPSRGFFGIGGREAIVKVTPKPRSRGKRRRRRRGGEREAAQRDDGEDRGGRATRKPDRRRERADKGGGEGARPQDAKPRSGGAATAAAGGSSRRRDGGPKGVVRRTESKGGEDVASETEADREAADRPVPDVNEQAGVARDFLTGLLEAFGLEGDVVTRVEDDVLYIDVTGDQTEALVGVKGAVMQSVGELTRTVIQRKTHGAPRMRLDISGYNERRREALRIYAGRLAEKLLAEGGEVMLEPMNAADRKVVHDAVADIEHIESYSEGEEPQRAVVLALAEGVEPQQRGEATQPESEPTAEQPEDG